MMQHTPMTDADDTTSLQTQLAAHRGTLARLLTQRAYFDPGLVPPHVVHGINEARADIARLKVALREAGVGEGSPLPGTGRASAHNGACQAVCDGSAKNCTLYGNGGG